MPLLHVIILAILQGLTEFLPVSSSAHLALAPWLFGWPDQGLSFDIALHIGTLAAVLIYFGRDWMQVFAQAFGLQWGADEQLRQNPRLLWFLAAASGPVAIAGFLLKDAVETWRSPVLIGSMLIGIGLLMQIGEVVGRRVKHLGQVTFLDSLVVGIAQALAIVPGTSRSGITITAALFRDFDRATAARFSFLLSTPAIGGAVMKMLLDLYKSGGVPPSMIVPFAVGIAVSGVTGAAVIALFLRYLRGNTLRFFVIYRIVFGIMVIALSFFRRPAG